jgi:hypothetical protein
LLSSNYRNGWRGSTGTSPTDPVDVGWLGANHGHPRAPPSVKVAWQPILAPLPFEQAVLLKRV